MIGNNFPVDLVKKYWIYNFPGFPEWFEFEIYSKCTFQSQDLDFLWDKGEALVCGPRYLLSTKKLEHWSVCSWGWSWVPSHLLTFLCFLASLEWATFARCSLTMKHFPFTGSKQCRLKSLRLWAKINFSFVKLLTLDNFQMSKRWQEMSLKL